MSHHIKTSDKIKPKRIYQKLGPVGLINISASIITIVAAIASHVYVYVADYLPVIATVGLFIYILLLSIFLFVQEYRFERKARYADASYLFHEVQHKIRDLNHVLYETINQGRRFEPEAYSKNIQDILTDVSHFFSFITAVRCRVCIKTFTYNIKDGNQPNIPPRIDASSGIQTFARDRDSASCTKEKGSNTRLRVSDNTAFEQILEENERYFFNNDLSIAFHNGWYKNTTFTKIAQKSSKIVQKKHVYHNFPYSSIIVLPIGYKVQKHDLLAQNKDVNENIFIGFLQIDSKSKDTFDERYDVCIGAAIADSLYSLIYQYGFIACTNAVQNNNSHSSSNTEKEL